MNPRNFFTTPSAATSKRPFQKRLGPPPLDFQLLCLFSNQKSSEDLQTLDRGDILVPLVTLPPPPDGGWGWVVVAASFLCNVIGDGIGYTFGVIMPHLVLHFDSDR
jgi:hypothetical protein